MGSTGHSEQIIIMKQDNLKFFKFCFFVSLLLSRVTVALPLSFLLPLVINPLKHTNRGMDTEVTIVLSHNNTSKVAMGDGGGHTYTNTVTDQSSHH